MGDQDPMDFFRLTSNCLQALGDAPAADACVNQEAGGIRACEDTVPAASAGYTAQNHKLSPSQ